jgi:hypothetical protein
MSIEFAAIKLKFAEKKFGHNIREIGGIEEILVFN